MVKWNENTFIDCIKDNCPPHILNVLMDFIKFGEQQADIVSWGRGEGHGTMTYKVKSDDWGIIPIFHISTNGRIKFLLNHMRGKVRKHEILRDYTIKLETNFMMDFDEVSYTADIYFEIEDLFHTKSDTEKFMETVKGISARLHQ